MAKSVHLEKKGAIAVVTLDRPPANAIDSATSRELYQAFREVEDDPGLRVAILTAAGERFFSAGWDLKAGEDPNADFGPGGFAGITEFFGRSKPIIAALNGLAAGGGLEAALSCELIVAAEHVEMMLPEVRIGLVADAGGLLQLPKRLPRAIANRMLLTGERLSAADAARHGLINQMVPGESLMDCASELAEKILACAPLSVKAVMAILEATQTLSVEQGFELLRSGRISAYKQLYESEDSSEGPRAFAEKRPPQWKGR